jgi:hypothetical protein
MATLTAADIQDLVAGTLRELGRMKFQQIAQSLQEYEVQSRWFKKDKVIFDSGYGIQRTLMTRLPDAFAHVGLYETDVVNVENLVKQINIPWRHARTAWAFERREVLMNRGESLIFNVIEPRRIGALIDMAEGLEDAGWSAPAVGDKKLPYGIPYWVVKNATTGFNGGYPGSHTTLAGIDLNDATNFKNYTDTYTSVTKADLIKKMRLAHRKIRFKSPVAGKDYAKPLADKYRIYVNDEVTQDMEDVGEAQNENLGRDLAKYHLGDVKNTEDGALLFRGHPIIWVPKLDADTTNPVYMIDHSTFMPVALKGDFMRESEVKEAPNQHNVFQVFVDLSYNFLCVDRRRNAVLYV